MKRLKLWDVISFKSTNGRYSGSRYNENLLLDRIGYAEFHYVHYPKYCNTKYYIK